MYSGRSLTQEVIWCVKLAISLFFKDSKLCALVGSEFVQKVKNYVDTKKGADFVVQERKYTSEYKPENPKLVSFFENLNIFTLKKMEITIPMDRKCFNELMNILYLLRNLREIHFYGTRFLSAYERDEAIEERGDERIYHNRAYYNNQFEEFYKIFNSDKLRLETIDLSSNFSIKVRCRLFTEH